MISIPKFLRSECVLQAEFFHECLIIGLPCTLELSTPAGRLDAAIFSHDWQMMLAAVEVKKRDRFSPGQIGRYKRLGVPVFGLSNPERTARLARQIKRDYLDNPLYTGVTYETILAMPRVVRSRGRKTIHPMDMDEDLNFRN